MDVVPAGWKRLVAPQGAPIDRCYYTLCVLDAFMMHCIAMMSLCMPFKITSMRLFHKNIASNIF